MDETRFREILKTAVVDAITDVHFAAGKPPVFRYSGSLMELKSERLEPSDTEWIARTLLEDRCENLDEVRSFEKAYELKGIGRFRASAIRQQGVYRIAMRVIPVEKRTLTELNLPKGVESIAELSRGLVLVTGATGQGKSTTLSAMIERINRTRKAHIITVEDPIEFTYDERRGLILQLEIGEDVESYKAALRRILRQDPDVIMIGEIRDKEAFETALEAAESGHLVLTAIHTSDAEKTIGRILGFYNGEAKQEARERLAANLAAIVSLRLLPRKDSGRRIPAVEIMRMTSAIEESLRSGRTAEISGHMERGEDYYEMQTFDQHILTLYRSGKIDLETALAAATRRADMEVKLTEGIQRY
jgi:twitching motility protein PilT